MRTTYRMLMYALAVEVLVQGMSVAYALAGLGKWVQEDGGVLNRQAMDTPSATFTGAGGLVVHDINGQMVIPALVLVLLVVSLFAKVPRGTRTAAILLGLVVLEVVMGIALRSVPFIAVLHVLNAFAIFVIAAMTGYRLKTTGHTAERPAEEVAA